ncbi:MAG: hypothetical protein AAGF81_20365, partial [Pseudomonadota bacterium]
LTIHQFDYQLQFRLSADEATWLITYEEIMRIPGRWDYVTVGNAEQSVAHFAKLIEVCADLL